MDFLKQSIEFLVSYWPGLAATGTALAGFVALLLQAVEIRKMSLEIRNLRKDLEDRNLTLRVATMDEIHKYARARIEVPEGDRGTRAQMFMAGLVGYLTSNRRERGDDLDFGPSEAIAHTRFTNVSRFAKRLLTKWKWRTVIRWAAIAIIAVVLFDFAIDAFSNLFGNQATTSSLLFVGVVLIEFSIWRELAGLRLSRAAVLTDLLDKHYWSRWWRTMYALAASNPGRTVIETPELQAEYVKLQEHQARLAPQKTAVTKGRANRTEMVVMLHNACDATILVLAPDAPALAISAGETARVRLTSYARIDIGGDVHVFNTYPITAVSTNRMAPIIQIAKDGQLYLMSSKPKLAGQVPPTQPRHFPLKRLKPGRPPGNHEDGVV